MDVGGTAREGWMAIIPLTVLILITTYIVGGPVQFANLVHQWGSDVMEYLARVIRYL